MRRPVEHRGTTRRVAVADGREVGQGRGETGDVTEHRNVGIRPAVDVVADGPRATAAPLQLPQLLWDPCGATRIEDGPAEEAVADAAQPELRQPASGQ